MTVIIASRCFRVLQQHRTGGSGFTKHIDPNRFRREHSLLVMWDTFSIFFRTESILELVWSISSPNSPIILLKTHTDRNRALGSREHSGWGRSWSLFPEAQRMKWGHQSIAKQTPSHIKSKMSDTNPSNHKSVRKPYNRQTPHTG